MSTSDVPVGRPAELEQALAATAWQDDEFARNPEETLSALGVDAPTGFHLDVRVQRRDTLYLVIPPALSDGKRSDGIVNQMDLWRSAEQFVWIMPQEAKIALVQMREQYRRGQGGGST